MAYDLAPGDAARNHRALDSLHSTIYFAPEAGEEFTAAGLDRARYHYFAGRAAPMGLVTAGVVTATFYNFSPAAVARAIPRAWELATPESLVAARLRAVDRSWRRLLGDDVVAGPEVAEAAELARAATVGLPADGRPLFAGHASLGWPDEPHLVLWHAISLLREFRGDGHVAALLCAGLSGLEALVTHTATGRGFTVPAAKATRGWSDEEWDAAVAGLTARGILTDSGELTDAGLALRAEIETTTDARSETPWLTLGDPGCLRLRELGKQLTRRIVAAGAFPAGTFAAPKA